MNETEISEECKKVIVDIQITARKMYVGILLINYCSKCSSNIKGCCELYKLPIEEAIAIEKKVDA